MYFQRPTFENRIDIEIKSALQNELSKKLSQANKALWNLYIEQENLISQLIENRSKIDSLKKESTKIRSLYGKLNYSGNGK